MVCIKFGGPNEICWTFELKIATDQAMYTMFYHTTDIYGHSAVY